MRLVIFAIATCASFLLVLLFRRIGLRRHWLDVPNERSSHIRPTPRGAGVVIAILSLSLFSLIAFQAELRSSPTFLICAVAVSLAGWLDDLYGLPIPVKLTVHLIVAVASVSMLGYWHSIGISTKYSIDLQWLGPAITVVWVVWSINAFNFIDGIDGLAGLQGMVTATSWSVIFGMSAAGTVFAGVAGACLGFLILNWHPAKVFMGDVGSSFLGYSLAVLPIAFSSDAEPISPVLPVVCILLFWPINFDAGWSRLARMIRGDRFWQPNREHFYQAMVDNGFSHSFVAALYGIFTVASSSAAFIFLNGSSKIALIPIALVLLASLLFAVVVDRLKKKNSHVEQ